MKNRIFALLVAVAMLLALYPAAMAEEVTGTGTAKGFGGDVTVTITLKDGVITNVEAVGNDETDGIGKNVITERDGWTTRTRDRKPSAHFEHSIAIHHGKPDILSSFDGIKEVLGDRFI